MISYATGVLKNKIGLHARPSLELVKLAKTFKSDISMIVVSHGPRHNAKSISTVSGLMVKPGTYITFRADGEDAQKAVSALKNLIETGLKEDDG